MAQVVRHSTPRALFRKEAFKRDEDKHSWLHVASEETKYCSITLATGVSQEMIQT